MIAQAAGITLGQGDDRSPGVDHEVDPPPIDDALDGEVAARVAFDDDAARAAGIGPLRRRRGLDRRSRRGRDRMAGHAIEIVRHKPGRHESYDREDDDRAHDLPLFRIRPA